MAKFQCPKCERSFGMAAHLARHQKSHEGDKKLGRPITSSAIRKREARAKAKEGGVVLNHLVTPQPVKYRKLFLSFPQKLKLNEWMNKNWERIVSKGITADEAAITATRDLRFHINGSHLYGLARVNGKKFPHKRRESGIRLAVGSDPLLRRLVARLYQTLGEAVPLELLPYLQGEELEETTATSVSRPDNRPEEKPELAGGLARVAPPSGLSGTPAPAVPLAAEAGH